MGEPAGSGPGFRRPVLIVQTNEFNDSAIRTTICVAVTSNLRLAEAPGNVRLTKKASGLSQESIVNVSQLITLDKRPLTGRAGHLPCLVRSGCNLRRARNPFSRSIDTEALRGSARPRKPGRTVVLPGHTSP